MAQFGSSFFGDFFRNCYLLLIWRTFIFRGIAVFNEVERLMLQRFVSRRREIEKVRNSCYNIACYAFITFVYLDGFSSIIGRTFAVLSCYF
jgi:hypothetical protein